MRRGRLRELVLVCVCVCVYIHTYIHIYRCLTEWALAARSVGLHDAVFLTSYTLLGACADLLTLR